MSVQELSVLYNLIFIGILVIVCGFFTGAFMLIKQQMFRWSWWVVSTAAFVAIVFITIVIWHNLIPFITGYPF